ncbi:hypothetical protein L7F22_062179 [Adiantum nelumboides]|nr:hypothetical protein [Adiantum nelumboides]
MQKGQGLLQQQGAKADGSGAGVANVSPTSFSFNNPSALSNPSASSPHTSSSSPAPSPRNPLPISNPNPNCYPSSLPGFKSHPGGASPSPDFHQFHPSTHPPKLPQPSSSPHFAGAQAAQLQQQQQWQQQLQQMQQQAQAAQHHHLQQQHQAHHHLQQQGQQHLQPFRKGLPGEQFSVFQGPFLHGVGVSTNGNAVGGPQLFLPPRGYSDANQHQAPSQTALDVSQASNSQHVQAQVFAQQMLLAAQKKAQGNAQQIKAPVASEQGGFQSKEDVNNSLSNQSRQHQARQGHATSSKPPGQFLLADQQMEQAQDAKGESAIVRAQPGYTQSMANTMRPPSAGALQNQTAMLVNGQVMCSMPPHQSHHLDLSSVSHLPPAQYMHPQLRAQLAAMQKAASEAGPGLSSVHQTASKAQETGVRNLGHANMQQHGGGVGDGHLNQGMILGKSHQGLPGGLVSNSNTRQHQQQQQQPQHQASDYSIERGVLSLNRSASNMPAPVLLGKSSLGASIPSRPEKTSGASALPSSDEAELQYLRQQQVQASMSASQAPNALMQQANYNQQMQQHQDMEHPQVISAQHQQHQIFQQAGAQNFQQQQLKTHAPTQPHPQPQLPLQPQPQPFSRQQLMILKAQILAFRRLKRGERLSLDVLTPLGISPDMLRSVPSQALTPQQSIQGFNAMERPPFSTVVEGAPAGVGKEDHERQGMGYISSSVSSKVDGNIQKPAVHAERSEGSSNPPLSQVSNVVDQCSPTLKHSDAQPQVRSLGEVPAGGQFTPTEQNSKEDSCLANNSNMAGGPCSPSSVPSGLQSKRPIPTAPNQQKSLQLLRRYRGPLFDFPPMGRKIDGLFQGNNTWGAPISLGYDVKQLLSKEGARVVNRKKSEKLKFIDSLLTSGVEKKGISADIIMKLRIEQKKLRLMALQSRIREEVEEHQQDIMALSERGYRKFVRSCERQRADLARQVIQLQKSTREKQLKSLFSWRKRLLEAHWAVRDARTTRNRGVAKYHERMLREFSKRRDEDRNKRMEALKNNDVDTYREMLKQQQTKLPGDAGERFQVLSSFLSQTEDYLQKLGGKISAVKYQQEREEAAVAAMLAAKAQGLSEEEVEAATIRARDEVDARLQSPERATESVSKYYSLAHAVSERILRQPSMLRAGILRDYQLVGLQWMLSLYNNRLNGILADEMGLGKTVQVMALIAYLMEFKGNNGPHLIIVPNAVIVNWKSELLRWLPSVSCIFYVGGKEQRTKLYSQEVCALKFNVLVTTYEFIMRDRSKLSKVEWKYLIIDEAQRMKDRESRLSRDLDRFKCQRRLLLTGTPLQNDLRELWSLLNLLLPEVFDNSKSFQDWFSMPFQKDNTSLSPEDDWLETEKKVIVIHRLHQILEPFMLRRRVEDVEGSLPAKVSLVLRCKMSALQAAIYDWIKTTGTIRLNPQDEEARVAARNGKRQKRAYAPLQNKCMELRKVCNHPLLNYPFYGEHMNEFSVRSCGKLWILDRILIKLQHTGHRVLLFSTMTKLLDILEDYLQWRGLSYRRIDGTTTLESRESAIVEFNRPGSDCFIFLLSIRAAGRGLNLQTADTVIIYDPDPNPKNEEQAVARAHRIGQKREVRVIYMEAVVETVSSFEKEDEIRSGGSIDLDDDDMAGKDRYVGSVESLVRNTIQQHKIEMADEVINAGRFDQRTTQEERRLTLEALLHDEERYQERVHDVPSLQEVNRMIARSDEEVDYFDQMDEEYDWPGEMLQHQQVPKWLCVGSREVNAAIAAMSKQALKKGTVEGLGSAEAEEKLLSEPFEKVTKKRHEMPLDKKSGPQSDSSKRRKVSRGEKGHVAIETVEGKVKKNVYDEEEEGEIRKEFIEDETDAYMITEPEEGEVSGEEFECKRQNETGFLDMKPNVGMELLIKTSNDASESSHDDEEDDAGRLEVGIGLTPPLVQQKFGSLAALESRPIPQVTVEELEEGEIAASGDSHFEAQVSDGSAQEQDEGEDEQALQPSIKRKRSARQPRRRPLEKVGISSAAIKVAERRPTLPFPSFAQPASERPILELDRQLSAQPEHKITFPLKRLQGEITGSSQTVVRTPDQSLPPAKRRQVLQPLAAKKPPESFSMQQPRSSLKHSRVPGFFEQYNVVAEPQKESTKPLGQMGNVTGASFWGRMPESTQKKCKAALLKLRGAVEKEPQAAIIFALPKRTESPGYYKIISNPIDAQTIEQRLEKFEYGSVLDFAADVLLMLDNAARFYKSPEVKAYIRRLQAMYLQRMHHSFHDIDFTSLKTRPLATISQTPISSTPPPRQRPSQNVALRSQAEPSVVLAARTASKGEPKEDKPPSRSIPTESNKRSHKKGKTPQTVQKASGRIKMKQEHGKSNAGSDFDKLRHPLDLVFCKKKRRPRGKASGKIRTINVVAPADTTNIGKNINIIRTGSELDNRLGVKIVGKKVRTAGVNSSGESSKHLGVPKPPAMMAGVPTPLMSAPAQKAMPDRFQSPGVINNRGPGILGFGNQWLTPVKKMRTDGGKRRPSHV